MKPHPNQGPEKLVSKSISIPVVERAGANPSHSGRGRGEAPFRTPQASRPLNRPSPAPD